MEKELLKPRKNKIHFDLPTTLSPLPFVKCIPVLEAAGVGLSLSDVLVPDMADDTRFCRASDTGEMPNPLMGLPPIPNWRHNQKEVVNAMATNIPSTTNHRHKHH